jgi:hypothetical protein
MAIYIEIRKVMEQEVFADFVCSLVDGRKGRIRLDKMTGDISLLEAIPGDTENRLFSRASHKLKKHWSLGEIPEKTSWAS